MGLSNFISGWNRRSSCHRDLRKLGMNLIPFPRVSTHPSNAPNLSFTYLCQQLHFLMPSYAPFYDPRAVKYEKNSVPELTKAYVAPPFHLNSSQPPPAVYSTAKTFSLLATLALGESPAVSKGPPNRPPLGEHQPVPHGRNNLPW